MVIGFDLDGVLCDINVVELCLIGQDLSIDQWYYKERKPLLNPAMFLSDDDKYIILTAREKRLDEITKKWIDRFLPGAKWFSIYTGGGSRAQEFGKKIARKKLEILKREKVEIYFDDNATVIKEFRKICKSIKFVQFGGRL